MIYSGKSAFVKLNTLPKVMQKNVDNILLCIHGGSRLYYAQKHNMKIPCVICEWRSRFSDTQKILTESAFVSLYNTPPRFIITQSGLRILELKNTHMP